MIKFTNPETDATFEALTPVDQFVDVPAKRGTGVCFRGMISTITPEAAERYCRFAGNLIRRKPAPVDPAAGTDTAGGATSNS